MLEVPEHLGHLEFLGFLVNLEFLDFLEKPDYCWLMGRMPLQCG